jgi:hypothetical protein
MSKIDLHKAALPTPLFRRLVRAVREVGIERLDETYKTNFWVSLDAKPNNIVEEVIARLTRLVRPGPRCTGVEWWLGRLPYGKSLPMHFDRDLTLEKQSDRVLHPTWGSILYLNRFPSSPTLILDQVLSRNQTAMVPKVAKFGRFIPPVPNHYVVYSGNLYHGVVAKPTARKPAGGSEKANKSPNLRLSLLVNYWEQRPLPPVCRDYDGSVYRALQNGY